MTPQLTKLLADGYAAVIGKGDMATAVANARTAAEHSGALNEEAVAELKRLEAMGKELERRCFLSAKNRDFLRAVLT